MATMATSVTMATPTTMATSIEDDIVLTKGVIIAKVNRPYVSEDVEVIIAPIKHYTSMKETEEERRCCTCNRTNIQKYDMKKKVSEVVYILKEYNVPFMIITCDNKECKSMNGLPMQFTIQKDKTNVPTYEGNLWNCIDCTKTFCTTYDLCDYCIK